LESDVLGVLYNPALGQLDVVSFTDVHIDLLDRSSTQEHIDIGAFDLNANDEVSKVGKVNSDETRAHVRR
jgi:hypothetical protein